MRLVQLASRTAGVLLRRPASRDSGVAMPGRESDDLFLRGRREGKMSPGSTRAMDDGCSGTLGVLTEVSMKSARCRDRMTHSSSARADEANPIQTSGQASRCRSRRLSSRGQPLVAPVRSRPASTRDAEDRRIADGFGAPFWETSAIKTASYSSERWTWVRRSGACPSARHPSRTRGATHRVGSAPCSGWSGRCSHAPVSFARGRRATAVTRRLFRASDNPPVPFHLLPPPCAGCIAAEALHPVGDLNRGTLSRNSDDDVALTLFARS